MLTRNKVIKMKKMKIKKVASKATHQMKEMFGSHPSITDEEAEKFSERAWGGLKNRTVYWDPCNWKNMGHINLRQDIFERAKPGLEASDEAQGLGAEAQFAAYRKAMETKSLLTSNWNIPIHAVPRVQIVTPGILPMANMLSRMTFNRDTLQTTPQTGTGAAAHFAESATAYTENDDVYMDGSESLYNFAVDSYGRANKISSLMSMVGGTIQNPRNTMAMGQLNAIRRYEETQIIQGQNGGDASGFKGLYEFATKDSKGAFNTDKSGGINWVDDITDGIEDVISNGANPDSVIVVTDKNSHKDIIHALRDYVRTGSAYKTRSDFAVTAPGIDTSFRAIDFDGTPIFKSYGAEETSGSREVYFFDASKHGMAMVSDAVLRPLASTGPYEFAATDAFGTMYSEGRATVGRYYDIA